ncbi:hypothetical protein HUT19_27965 [Streptomyces sp. NA02950]|uniref:hypothetical protein n=1 Tax=Streptomyces sp. NA02950 TaxID=2742137 RepID=UPI001591882D|nr:hypothetical protein [Streptomyces sp. NA02950]QKV95105.1 hypothetical protein HUT19_27965 [Streptomyces sp. NA02950]
METAGKRWIRIPLYTGLVWLLGALLVPVGHRLALVAWWGRGTAGVLVASAVVASAMVAALAYGVVPVRRTVPMCRTAAGRLGWALVVFCGGTVGLAAGVGAERAGALDVGGPLSRAALCGVPYALVAALFIAGVVVRVISGVAVLGVVAYGTAVTHKARQAEEVHALMTRTSLARQELILPDPPAGYRMDEGEGDLANEDFWVRYVYTGAGRERPDVVFAVSRGSAGGNGRDARNARGEWRDGRITESAGTRGDGSRAVVLTCHRGGLRLTVTAHGAPRRRGVPDPLDAVDRDELRRMLRKSRTASDGQVLRALRRPVA